MVFVREQKGGVERLVTERPNPQGKGQCTTLGLMQAMECGVRLPAPQDDGYRQLVEDLIGSLLVLSCEFRFRPVKGMDYHIYLHKGRLQLSLVGPQEGGAVLFDRYLGGCRLQEDYTWHVECLDPQGLPLILHDSPLLDTGELQSQLLAQGDYDQVLRHLLSTEIGTFRRELGYYQNVLNHILGKTIALRGERLLSTGSGSTAVTLSGHEQGEREQPEADRGGSGGIE